MLGWFIKGPGGICAKGCYGECVNSQGGWTSNLEARWSPSQLLWFPLHPHTTRAGRSVQGEGMDVSGKIELEL